MKVYELIRTLVELSPDGNQEIAIVTHDYESGAPTINTDFNVESVLVNKNGQIVEGDDEEADCVVVIGI